MDNKIDSYQNTENNVLLCILAYQNEWVPETAEKKKNHKVKLP